MTTHIITQIGELHSFTVTN